MNLQYPNSGFIKTISLSPWMGICILIIASLIASCSQISKPPVSWEVGEKAGSGQGCGDISGVYQNKGIAAPDNNSDIDRLKHPKYLSEYFEILRVNGFEHRWITNLEFTSISQGRIKVVFKQNDRVIDTRIMHEKKDYTCAPRGIKMTDSLMPSNPYGPEYVSNEQILYRVADRSLIVKDSHSEIGVFAVIPYGGKTTEYYRFPPVMEKEP